MGWKPILWVNKRVRSALTQDVRVVVGMNLSVSGVASGRKRSTAVYSSLPDWGIVGYKSTAAVYFSPSF